VESVSGEVAAVYHRKTGIKSRLPGWRRRLKLIWHLSSLNSVNQSLRIERLSFVRRVEGWFRLRLILWIETHLFRRTKTTKVSSVWCLLWVLPSRCGLRVLMSLSVISRRFYRSSR